MISLLQDGNLIPGVSGADSTVFGGYDGIGDITSRVDGRGVTTTYTYATDPGNLATNVHYALPASPPAGLVGTPDVNITYDGFGRAATVDNGITHTTYGAGAGSGYDDDNNVMSVQTGYYSGASILFDETVAYTYYPNDSRESMTVPSGSFEYVYDAIGRQTGITNPCGETTRWGYYNNNWLSSQTDYNASGSVVLSTSYEYDGRGFLTDLLNATSTGSVLCEFGSTNPTYELTYDAVGNCSAMSVSYPVSPGYSGTTDYAYDSRDELTQESSTRNSGYDDTSAYDNAENPTTLRGAAVPAANADNQISTSSSVYDGAGNPTTYAGNSLTFDTENRMTAYGSVLSCGYNIDDLRAWKRNSAGTTYFLYDQFRSVCEMNSSGAVTATNTEGNTGLVSRNASGNSVFYTFDPPGSTQCVLNSAGSVVTSSMNDAFGETAGSVASPYGFGGQQGYFTDMETGLLLLTGRYYDPGVGRFLTRDPSGDRGGINLYAYCHNNPTNLSDPFGTEPVNPVIGGIDCLESIGASIAQGTGVSCSAVGACVGTAVALAMIALLPELSGAAACLIGIIGSAVGDLAAGICDCLTGAPMPNGCEAAFDMMNAIMGCFVGIFLQWIPKSAIEAGLEIALDTTLHIVGMGEAAGC